MLNVVYDKIILFLAILHELYLYYIYSYTYYIPKKTVNESKISNEPI